MQPKGPCKAQTLINGFGNRQIAEIAFMYPTENKTTHTPRKRSRLSFALTVAGLLGATALTVPFMLPQSSVNAASADENLIQTAAPSFGFADLVEMVQPAVVSIQVTSQVVSETAYAPGSRYNYNEQNESWGGKPDSQQHEFNQPRLHDDEEESGEQYRSQPFWQPGVPHEEQTSEGSGFIISADGYVVTNHHVIEDGTVIQVTLADGRTVVAELVGSDEKTDLALLRIEVEEVLPFVAFSDEEPRVGDWVVAVGNPFGLGNSVSTGIISAQDRDIGSGPYDDYIQIDAPINRGNSGGPAFNLEGEVIGVNTAIYSPTGGNVGIGFAIPATMAEGIIEDLRADGEVTRGWLGVHIQAVTSDIAESLDLEGAEGALVAQVADESPANSGGIRVGDLILQVNDAAIDDPKALARVIAGVDPGTEIEMTIFRDGALETVDVTIGELPGTTQEASLQPEVQESASLADLGMTLATVAGAGVLVEAIEEDGPASEIGLRVGDRILEVGGEQVGSPSDVEQRLEAMRESGRNSILLLVSDGARQRFVALHLNQG